MTVQARKRTDLACGLYRHGFHDEVHATRLGGEQKLRLSETEIVHCFQQPVRIDARQRWKILLMLFDQRSDLSSWLRVQSLHQPGESVYSLVRQILQIQSRLVCRIAKVAMQAF
jgi:hypothetical protein